VTVDEDVGGIIGVGVDKSFLHPFKFFLEQVLRSCGVAEEAVVEAYVVGSIDPEGEV
jgi:hypothetical protein